jgi:hypothetical protein
MLSHYYDIMLRDRFGSRTVSFVGHRFTQMRQLFRFGPLTGTKYLRGILTEMAAVSRGGQDE